MLRFVKALAFVATLGGCSTRPTLELVVPASVAPGAPISVKATATTADGKVGVGVVTFTASGGTLSDGTAAPLDTFGRALTTFSCEPDCAEGTTFAITARWSTTNATLEATGRTNVVAAVVTGPPGPDAGRDGGLDAGPACTHCFPSVGGFVECGSTCVGDALVVCTATSVTVTPQGCSTDGGVDGGLDAGDFDAGLCDLTSRECTCTIPGFIIPCCTGLCLGGVPDRAWICPANGKPEFVPASCN